MVINEEIKLHIATQYAEYVSGIVRSTKTLPEEIDDLRERIALSGLALGDKVATSATADAIPDGVAKLRELISRYATELIEYRELTEEMHNRLQMIDSVECEALKQHYLLLVPWEQLCVDMHYTYRGMMKVRRRGLLQLYDVMPVEFKDVLPKAIEKPREY